MKIISAEHTLSSHVFEATIECSNCKNVDIYKLHLSSLRPRDITTLFCRKCSKIFETEIALTTNNLVDFEVEVRQRDDNR